MECTGTIGLVECDINLVPNTARPVSINAASTTNTDIINTTILNNITMKNSGVGNMVDFIARGWYINVSFFV